MEIINRVWWKHIVVPPCKTVAEQNWGGENCPTTPPVSYNVSVPSEPNRFMPNAGRRAARQRGRRRGAEAVAVLSCQN